MKIKMCGITTPADVAAVNEVRPDYIGMVMYFPKSKRNVSVETARRLLEELRKDVKKVAVVVSPDAGFAKHARDTTTRLLRSQTVLMYSHRRGIASR